MTKALIIIDMLVKDMDNLYCSDKIIKNQVKLVKAFRDHKCKVIITGGSKTGKPSKNHKKNPVMLKLWGNEDLDKKGKRLPNKQLQIIPELLDGAYDLYINKPEYSAFYKTKLESYLRAHNINELFIAGIYAGCCVYFTGADAAMRGIQPILITDAAASLSPKALARNINNFKTFLGPAISTKEALRKL